ncbi:MAG: hypothetical protein A2458_03610 [Candidatus Kerfeldbacteria bacterium RIFOXYC2_FULL_38_9]|uniref:Ribosomal RNA large subunit methyltransferase K/L-like methyltransferase domain-containing protein n=1 Tax=Candidatus Kerfeldbacteria bacterium RIFOXYB2_FULL_38_14 TaxID=1798547 RepID=A0A1G2BHK4_9BACT|nr:MAG: hypothetical protein A2319_04595 [Candidatus Kerfeldbacteria bacterium RIFOXYB2_FULL_38_14]OGY88697.1 MAG: hypothetical protein A2458_03610 [Candidatus Kerfeldbacteria bacterium RIFOXYC2_FULL_38_9]
MQKKSKTYAFILGSHPDLSFLELEKILTPKNPGLRLKLQKNVAILENTPTLDSSQLMEKLGGVVKIVEIIGEFEEEEVFNWLSSQINPASKFHFGFSLYRLDSEPKETDVKTLHRLGLTLKKTFKKEGISCRFVSAQSATLSSVIVHKERLLKNGVDVVLLKSKNQIIFGKTLAVQPFQKFSKRDYGRPRRDQKSGMLPPKIARIMLNIASPQPSATILDPFCGSGTILTEALLLGYKNISGSDLNPKAIADTKQNLAWSNLPSIPLYLTDIKNLEEKIKKESIDCVVTEGYLGKPQPQNPQQEREQLTFFYQEVFANLKKILKPNACLVIALPAWRNQQKLLTLPLSQTLHKMGYQSFHAPLIYGRPWAVVVRHIYFLNYSK